MIINVCDSRSCYVQVSSCLYSVWSMYTKICFDLRDPKMYRPDEL
jgi:hypothetical protein